MEKIRFRLLAGCSLAGIALLCSTSLWSESVKQDGQPDPLFSADEVLVLTLVGPFNQLARDRADEPESRPGKLLFTDTAGQSHEFSLNIRPRGKSRRDRKVCSFPPLRLSFTKQEVKGTLFAKQKNLKLVTHCRSSEKFQNYVLKEYLVYRILNELTPMSFRVRLLKVTYEDSDPKRDSIARYGFLIEHKNRLAKRIDSKVVEPAGRIPVASLNGEQAAIAELFQFLVSNTDYSFIAPPEADNCCHNAVLFDAGEGNYYPIPYDFDRTGLVSPPNGKPDGPLGQNSFRDRVYRGFCRDEALMVAALEKTRESRGAIEELISTQSDLDERSTKQALKFVASYYQIIDDDKKRSRELKCRGLH